MSNLSQKVADSELKILKILWQHDQAITMPEIRKALQPLTGWSPIMVKTMLYRLVEKGVVAAEKQIMYTYKPLITEREYNDYATKAFVEKLYDGNTKNLVASLIADQNLTQEDIDELRSLLQEKSHE